MALGVCGGIAAYKAVEVARLLMKGGARVSVVMSRSAANFIGPLTFSSLTGNPVRIEMFPEVVSPQIVHTDLGRTSDLIVVAPATAKTISRCAAGASDDLIPAMVLASACPVIFAPAMHPEMWSDDATRSNVAVLTARGMRFVGPDSGPLAGPDEGIGRLVSPEAIAAAAAEELAQRTRLEGQKLVVTAGGTREAIDAVRFIGNRSSGKMGHAIAAEASRRGATVVLITAATEQIPPPSVEVVPVTSAAEMAAEVYKHVEGASALIMAAAVADFTVADPRAGKLSKSAGPPKIELAPTDDILAEVGRRRGAGDLPGLKALVGFCAETENLESRAIEKRSAKGADMIAANLVGPAAGFDVDHSRLILAGPSGAAEPLGEGSKRMLARLLLEKVADLLFDGKRPGAEGDRR